ncbi:MAG: ABC transporter substrate-binding protein [Candidatus Methanomethylicaceae archaeon]
MTKKATRNATVFLSTSIISIGVSVLVMFEPYEQNRSSVTVNMAFNIPLTGSFGIYGQTIRDGALMAADDLKTRQSPVKFVLDIQDNLGEPKTALSIFQRQNLKRWDIYVSGVKPQTMAIFDRVVAEKRPYFVWIFDAFTVERYPNVFRTWVNYKYEPQKYFQYIKHKKAKRVSIAIVNMPHTIEEFQKIVIPTLRKQGVQVFYEVYEWDTRQYRDIILKLKSKNPDVYILNGFQENLVGLVRALRTYNLVKDGNVIGSYDLLDAAQVLDANELEGLRVVAPEFNIVENPNRTQWRKRFRQRYGREPLYTDAYSYDMMMIIEDAAKRLRSPLSKDDWIRSLRETNISGVTGRLRFDKGGDLVLSLRIGRYTNGKLTLDESEQKR